MGYEMIRWMQSTMHGPGWERVWHYITDIYSEQIYIALLPLVFWLLPRRFARIFTVLFFTNMWLNAVLKGLVGLPRPSAGEVRVLVTEETFSGYGLPSGHAQGALVTWWLLARGLGGSRVWVMLAWLVALLVGLSRLYLGVHFPADIVGGLAVGTLVVLLGVPLYERAAGRVDRWPLLAKAALAVLAPAAMLAVCAWVPAVARIGISSLYSYLGALSGFALGTVLEEAWVGYDHRGPWPRQLLKLAIGLPIALGLRAGLKLVLPATDPGNYLRYLAVAFCVACVIPWLFTRLPGRRGRLQTRAA